MQRMGYSLYHENEEKIMSQIDLLSNCNSDYASLYNKETMTVTGCNATAVTSNCLDEINNNTSQLILKNIFIAHNILH